MDTHTHIFLQTPEGDLSEGMHDLNSGYVSVFNMWHDRRGPLFWGRFKGILVEEDYHYWELSRYIHLNPVRAGMVKKPEEYRWGSCRYYFSEKDAPEWLCWEEILGREGKGLRAARQAYREFLAEGIKNPPKSPLREAAAALLGSTGFIERMRALLTREAADEAVPEGKKLRKGLTVRQIERAVCGSFRVTPRTLRVEGKQENVPRKMAVYLTRRLTGMKVGDIGRHFGNVKTSSISKCIRRFEKRMGEDHSLQEKARKIERMLGRSSCWVPSNPQKDNVKPIPAFLCYQARTLDWSSWGQARSHGV